MNKTKEVILYQAKSGAIELRGDTKRETIWATQAEIANIFDVNPQAITRHLSNIYKEKELHEKATCSKTEQVQTEGGRAVKRAVKVYNLGAIISVGYRISSKTGTRFRQWATKTLRKHITEGYTVNRRAIAGNYEAFLEAVQRVKTLLPSESVFGADGAMELVKLFAATWVSLDAYDKSSSAKRYGGIDSTSGGWR